MRQSKPSGCERRLDEAAETAAEAVAQTLAAYLTLDERVELRVRSRRLALPVSAREGAARLAREVRATAPCRAADTRAPPTR